jgi:iron complex transport system substrate-binding protein
MKFFSQAWWLVLALAVAACGKPAVVPVAAPASVQVTTLIDGAGRTVKVPAAPQRIVSLSPAATDILEIALNLHAEVAGVTRYCKIPAEDEKRVARIGGVVDPDYERILALQPDLVIAPLLADKTLQDKLIALGLTVVVLHPEGLQGILDDIRLLGGATGQPAESEAAAQSIEDIRTLAASRWASVPEDQRPRVLVRMGDSSPAPGAYVDDLITAAGGRNILPRGLKAWVEVSPENVLQLAPDLIVDIPSPDNPTSAPGPEKSTSSGPTRVVTISQGGEFYHPGPGVGAALWDLARTFYPAQFPEAMPPAAVKASP